MSVMLKQPDITACTDRTRQIVVLDDDRVQLSIINSMLKSLGAGHTVTTDDPDAAIEILQDNPCAVAFVDLNMPKVSGLEFIRWLGDKKFKGSLVLMSGHNQRILESSRDLACSYELHVMDIMQKPLQKQGVGRILQRLQASAEQPAANSMQPARASLTTAEIDDEITGKTSSLVLQMQPKYDMKTARITGCEVLTRWRRGNEILPPSLFIPVAVASNQIHDLSMLIFRKALALYKGLAAAGHEIDWAVNFPIETLSLQDVPQQLVELSHSAGVDPSRFTLEVTEDQIYGSIQGYLENLMHLIFNGFKLSIDDFGTGQSSLANLRAIPFAELKVDRTFVHGAWEDSRSAAVFTSSVHMAKQLGMRVVAEGGENENDWNFAREAGCDSFQGYYKSKPVGFDALLTLLQEQAMRVSPAPQQPVVQTA
jgi:EAL domain-containing protein (putative c-di-GMP-specific phosphodiesterase class I)